MNGKWSIIPDIEDIDRFIGLADEFDTAFEYNDFFIPKVYQDENEVDRRIKLYKSLNRDRSGDTLHGVFYDIAVTSMDSVIRNRSRMLVEQSMKCASELGCKGVVFHTGLIAGLTTDSYVEGWLSDISEYLPELADRFPDLCIYMENTFEQTAYPLVRLMERLAGYPRIRLCLDYAHARLTTSPITAWTTDMKPYTAHMHLNDNDLKSDLHLAAGDGQIDFKEFERLTCDYDPDIRVLLEVSGYDRTERSLRYMCAL